MPAGVTILVQPSLEAMLMFFARLYKVTQEGASWHFYKKTKQSWISYKWLLQDTDIHIPELVQCAVNGRDRVLSFCCSLLPFLLIGHGFYFLYSIYDYYFIDWYIYLIVYFLDWRFGKKKKKFSSCMAIGGFSLMWFLNKKVVLLG